MLIGNAQSTGLGSGSPSDSSVDCQYAIPQGPEVEPESVPVPFEASPSVPATLHPLVEASDLEVKFDEDVHRFSPVRIDMIKSDFDESLL